MLILQWMDNISELSGLKQYIYKEDRKIDDDGYPIPEKENLTFKSGDKLTIAGQTFLLITNMN